MTGVNLHSYAHTATRRSVKASNQQNEGDDICESTMMKKTFISFAEETLKVSVDEIEITAIHELPKRKDGSTPVIVQFLSADKKKQIMRHRKKPKGSDIFLNDHFTHKNKELFAEARRLKKEGHIFGTWTMNYNMLVNKNEHVTKVMIMSKQDLDKLKM